MVNWAASLLARQRAQPETPRLAESQAAGGRGASATRAGEATLRGTPAPPHAFRTTVTYSFAAENEARIAADVATKAMGDVKSAIGVAEARASGTAKNRDGADVRFQSALSTLNETFRKLPKDLQVEIARRREELSGAEVAYEQAVFALQRARDDEAKQRRDDSAQHRRRI